MLLRQSYLLINTRQQKKLEQLGLNEERLFNSIDTLLTNKLKQEGIDEQQFFKEEWQNMQTLLDAIAQKAQSIDPTLKDAAAATKTKIDKQIVRLQQKMLRAEKRKLQTYKNQIAQLKAELFPSNQLQERYCNFLDFYGSNLDLIKNLIEATQIENPMFNILQINN